MNARNRKNFLLLVALFLFVLVFHSVRDAQADSRFGYRTKITVNSNQVSNGPQTNFPFLFNTTNANLKTTANVDRVGRPTGAFGDNYNQASTAFFQGISQILAGGDVNQNLSDIQSKLQRLLSS